MSWSNSKMAIENSKIENKTFVEFKNIITLIFRCDSISWRTLGVNQSVGQSLQAKV